MRNPVTRLLLSLVALSLLGVNAFACSRVFLHGTRSTTLVARTMDLFFPDQGRLTVYPRGLHRGGSGENMLQWTSRYGSVAITSLGIVSTDGLNESGLSANVLYLDDTTYEPRDQRKGVFYNQWVQFILDNFSTVGQALKAMNEIQIVPLKILGHEWPLHVSIADRTGDTAVIEFVGGKMFVYRGPNAAVMTNEPPLSEQIDNLKNYQEFGGVRSVPETFDPVSRFVRASVELKAIDRSEPNSQAKRDVRRVIESVTVPMNSSFISHLPATQDWILQYLSGKDWPTIWTSLADLENRKYYIRSVQSGNQLWINLPGIDFSERQPIRDLDICDKTLSGDAAKFLQPAKPGASP